MPALSKVCPVCQTRADGRDEIEVIFGYRTMDGRQVPQSWCRSCRSSRNRTAAQACPAVARTIGEVAARAGTVNPVTSRLGTFAECGHTPPCATTLQHQRRSLDAPGCQHEPTCTSSVVCAFTPIVQPAEPETPRLMASRTIAVTELHSDIVAKLAQATRLPVSTGTYTHGVKRLSVELEGGWSRELPVNCVHTHTRSCPSTCVHIGCCADCTHEHAPSCCSHRCNQAWQIDARGNYGTYGDNYPCQGGFHYDGSVSGVEGRAGEVAIPNQSPCFDMVAFRQYVSTYAPDSVNTTCGTHFHVSFETPDDYALCAEPEFYPFFLTRVMGWIDANISTRTFKERILTRLNGTNRYCCISNSAELCSAHRSRHTAQEQRVRTNKDSVRYAHLNYAEAQRTNSIECRLFYGMKNPDLICTAADTFFRACDDWLAYRKAQIASQQAERELAAMGI